MSILSERDSEGEEEEHDESNGDNAKSSSGDNSDNKSGTSSRPISPSITVTSITVTTKIATLVSYHDDTIASDEGEADDDIPQQVIFVNDNDKHSDEELLIEEGVTIPPEPAGQCSAELQDKITKLYEKMQSQQMDMNAVIQKRKDFRNPSIYEKLIQYCDLNELGTNYPPSIYDPLKWSKESFYEDLAKVQKAEMDRREKERKGKVEFISGTKKHEEDAKNKRKSKWDMPALGASTIKPPTLVAPPTLTTAATGTKSTVISAFGSLPKKPRI
ncbi:SAP30-binding protein isoform X2 [Cylas formicarius]|uniref:SAP30-binding protein isoform X2 n=1 Tax=Cylas formicarius TaxID=197179 RepID=UPI002958C907|nr:SAP30-binding protein isoform X2 [Cylas formicarius]